MTNIFGTLEVDVQYMERYAAYVVIIAEDKVAMVKSNQKYFLLGGGSYPGETPEKTVVREIKEEVSRSVSLVREIGQAIQYFYSSTDDMHYKMLATFYEGKFTSKQEKDIAEHKLDWLSLREVEQSVFHACHAWAIQKSFTTSE